MNKFLIRAVRPRSCAIAVLSIMTLYVHQVWAVAVANYDSSGKPVYLQESIVKNPDIYLSRMQQEFKRGNLSAVGQYTAILRKALPQNPDVAALSAISFISLKDLSRGQKELSIAEKLQKNNLYSLIAKSMLLQHQNKLNKAAISIKKAIDRDGSHPYPYNVLGRIRFTQEKYKAALKNFQKAVKLTATFHPGYLNLGATNYFLGNYQAALTDFSTALRLIPDSDKAHRGIALTYAAMNKPALALGHFQKVLELNHADTNVLPNIVVLQLKLGQYKNAENTAFKMSQKNLPSADLFLADATLHLGNAQQALQILSSLDQNNPAVNYQQGFSYLVQGKYKKALELMQKTLKADKKHFGAFAASLTAKMNLNENISTDEIIGQNWPGEQQKLLYFFAGTILTEQGKAEKALQNFKKSAGMIAGFSAVGLEKASFSEDLNKPMAKYINLGVLFYYNNLFKQAQTQFSTALVINPDSVMANYWNAQIFLVKRDREQSLNFLEKAVKTAPHFFSALYAIAEVQFLSENDELAEKFYKKALEVKNDSGIVLKLAMLNEKHRKYEAAEQYYQQFLVLSPDLFIGYNQLAWLYAKRGVKLDKAMRLAIKADKLQPGNKGITDTIGWIYYHSKDYNKALDYIRRANNMDNNDPTVLYHLGAVQNVLGKSTQAKENLQKALSISNDFEEAEAARKLLQH